MICKSENITKMICEFRNDIETLYGNELKSWQIKSTTRNSVRVDEVYDSVKLFNFLNITYEYSQLVLVSNRNFTSFNMQPLAYYNIFPDLKSKIQQKFDGKLDENFLAKVKLMKGPELDSIRIIITEELSCLPNNRSSANDLISFVDNIWIGLKRNL